MLLVVVPIKILSLDNTITQSNCLLQLQRDYSFGRLNGFPAISVSVPLEAVDVETREKEFDEKMAPEVSKSDFQL